MLASEDNINKRYDRKKVVLFLNAFQRISLIVSPQPMLLDTCLTIKKILAMKFW